MRPIGLVLSDFHGGWHGPCGPVPLSQGQAICSLAARGSASETCTGQIRAGAVEWIVRICADTTISSPVGPPVSFTLAGEPGGLACSCGLG